MRRSWKWILLPLVLTLVPMKAQAAEETVWAVTRVNVRSGPGTDYEILGVLDQGRSVDRCQEENGWSAVETQAGEVYICSDYLSPQDPETPSYQGQPETVYAAGDVNVRSGPGTEFEKVGFLHQGDSLTRLAIGNNGWSRVDYDGQTAYIATEYLSRQFVAPKVKAFDYQYMAPGNMIPYALFTPRNVDLSRPQPLIISLHGAVDVGTSRSGFENRFLVKDLRHWEDFGLEAIPAYVVCPHLTGAGYSEAWNTPESADNIFALIAYLLENYNIDPDRIILQGHSMGAQGALYMAADERACFSALVLVSGYEPYRPWHHVNIPIRGYSGNPDRPGAREHRVSYNFMEEAFTQVFGRENWFRRDCSHDAIPGIAFREDRDGDGRSDLVDWMLSQ